MASCRVLPREFRAASFSDVFSICHADRKHCNIRDMNMRMSSQPRCEADSVWARRIRLASRI